MTGPYTFEGVSVLRCLLLVTRVSPECWLGLLLVLELTFFFLKTVKRMPSKDVAEASRGLLREANVVVDEQKEILRDTIESALALTWVTA